ncbi:MAG: hypothetical protein E7485_06445 [Ruminococcaceae bacterium]|nr:hypothetical protein [Oscillospiraceae bacterium]
MRKAKRNLELAAFITPFLLPVCGYFAYLIRERNFVALGAIALSCMGIGLVLGEIMQKFKKKR